MKKKTKPPRHIPGYVETQLELPPDLMARAKAKAKNTNMTLDYYVRLLVERDIPVQPLDLLSQLAGRPKENPMAINLNITLRARDWAQIAFAALTCRMGVGEILSRAIAQGDAINAIFEMEDRAK